MTIDKYLSYRGDIQAIAGVGADLAFVTLHADRQATGLYRLDLDKLVLTRAGLPEGGRCLAVDEQNVWVGGSDGRVYLCPAASAPGSRGPQFSDPIVALALLMTDRLAVLAGTRITILNRADGKTIQTLDLPEVGTCLTVAPTGDWFVAGTDKGTIAVFEAEGKPEFAFSASDRLHEGAVTALLFETNDLRFLSAGADLKLFSTYARGNLEPEDRGRGNNHTDVVTGLAGWVQGRFYTGGRDSTLKSWPPGQGTRPVTHKDGVAKVAAGALVIIHTKPHLAIACEDNTLRIFSLDDEGKFGELTHRIHDAIATAKNGLAATDATLREAALKTLAEFGDAVSLDIVGAQMTSDADHTVRLLAAQLLSASKHPRAAVLVAAGLAETYEAVRTTSFHGLRKHRGENDLHPIDLALKTEKPDLGKLAVQALEALAAKDDQALTRLSSAVNAKTFEVRQAALMSLEKAFDSTSAEADLWALGSQFADVRRLALIRLYHRNLLEPATVRAALRRHSEDADAEVRRMAFLLTLVGHETLLITLRALDPDLHRQFSDLEGTAPDGTPRKDVEPKPQQVMPSMPKLSDADLEPLSQATASRSLDTCLRGARGLAAVRDPRAFGLLLQLSREEQPAARVQVCWAMAALGDPRVLSRLRSLLQDADGSVRDAACTALIRAHANDSLAAADVVLNAPHEDVRRRGLQVLLDTIRKTTTAPLPLEKTVLLLRALNDASAHVRRETFKAVLNLATLGTASDILRFALQSVHVDVRREALTEVMAQINEAWAWTILLSLLNDPDKTLRDEALAFGVKKFKDREVEILAEALKARFTDMRFQAVEGLIKKATKPAQSLLVGALGDPEATVRLKALQALIDGDARDALTDALKSQHADVRIAAAVTLAKHGLAVAREPLLAQVQKPKPIEAERVNDWANLIASAVLGLGHLGDPMAQPIVAQLLNHERADLRMAAIQALVGMARPDATGVLRGALHHADPEVKYRAALGLAYAGDAHAAPIVFSAEGKKLLTAWELLAAACILKPAGDEQLAAMLDETSDTLRNAPLLVMMLREMVDGGPAPVRALTCLASKMPRVRLTAARALECFAQPDEFAKFVVELFNDREDYLPWPWKVPADVVRSVALVLAFGTGQMIARTVPLFEHLKAREQAVWDLAWSMNAECFAKEIAALTPPSRAGGEAGVYRQLALGAYVGLAREQGDKAQQSNQQSNLSAIIRVRQTALARIVALADADPGLNAAARSVCVQALGDPNQPVRQQAFEALQKLGIDATQLGALAIETGHLDLGAKGLELLADGTSIAEGEGVLEQVMLTRRDHLAWEAAKLLMTRRPEIAVMQQALNAAHEDIRQEAVASIAAGYEKSSDAQHALRQALESRYQKVRLVAAITLGMKKDPRAFDALVKSLHSQDNVARQNEIIGALLTLGDPRTSSALLDRLENDPAGTADVQNILTAIGSFRQPAMVDRLLAYGERLDVLRTVYPVLLTISGHDQPIADAEDENPDKRWEKEQYPRHDAVLARLMEHALRHGAAKSILDWLFAARWARGKEVDPVLAQLTYHADDGLRNEAIEVIGWRLRKRSGPADALVKALKHRNPTTQFLAAKNLALAKRADGISVLLAAIEYLEDLHQRGQAVYALGQLEDNRAVETLLKLAREEGHALQLWVLEAIGHFAKSPEADEIFKLLERKVNNPHTDAPLHGLRWFNTRAAWQIIRQKAMDRAFRHCASAIGLLAHHDEPATRDLLLQILTKPFDEDRLVYALRSARKRWGMESLEPDYAALRSGWPYGIDDSIKRVCDKGEADRIFAILPESAAEVQTELATSLMNRKDLPVAQARTALDHPDVATVSLAAHILGRVAAQDSGPAIDKALKKWHAAWVERRKQVRRANATTDGELARHGACLQMLLWFAQRAGIAADALRPMVEFGADDAWYRPIRLAALAAMAHGSNPTAAVLSTLEAAAIGNDAEARTLAVEALSRLGPKQAAALADKILADRASFRRLADAPIQATLQTAASQQHYQSVVLPHLIARGDRDTLAAVASNAKLPDATRLGAIEGLAALAEEAAETNLVELGKNEKAPEELRKAAWRGVRRSRRARKTLI